MKTCTNHPNKEAFSVCHGCGKDYCSECLDEGREYYYCKKPECQKLLQEEMYLENLAKNLICPNCSTKIELPDVTSFNGKVHCHNCEALIDFNAKPPKILKKEIYTELLSSFNQGDIALIKSILNESKIDYYISGEHFLTVDPLIQPARFFINDSDVSNAKELLKDFELHIWGASKRDAND